MDLHYLVIYLHNGKLEHDSFYKAEEAMKFAAEHNGYLIHALRMESPKTVKMRYERLMQYKNK